MAGGYRLSTPGSGPKQACFAHESVRFGLRRWPIPPFPKPAFKYSYNLSAQLNALRRWRDHEPGRSIPGKTPDTMLLASWNIANLGVQQRRTQDYRLIAELISWFDLTAIQEVNDNVNGLRQVLSHLPAAYRAVFSDKAGNDERLAFVYDSTKIELLEQIGEVAIPPADLRFINLPGNGATFQGFDRTPYLASFRTGGLEMVLVNNHIFFGSDDDQLDMDRRALETFAVARWADLTRQSAYSYSPHIVVVGDFNLPMMDWDDPIYAALGRRGLYIVPHSTQIGTNLRGDKHYDQIAFFPGLTGSVQTAAGVFDFDGAVFRQLWDSRPANDHADFFAFVKYYMSDHRIMWSQFEI